LDISELDKAKQVLLAKGGLGGLVMNLMGSGGSGKSFVLDATKSFCKKFCKAIGKPFNDSVFIVTATTNTAAAQLKCNTIHSIAGL
jgi:predicted ATP-binding protein involved in virulence